MTADPLSPLMDALREAGTNTGPSVVRLAVVTGTSGSNILVQFEGEGAASTKSYRKLSAAGTPANGTRVVMLRTGQSWVCLGGLA